MLFIMQCIHIESGLDEFYDIHLDLTSVIRLCHCQETVLFSRMNIAMHTQN